MRKTVKVVLSSKELCTASQILPKEEETTAGIITLPTRMK
jgi:hypothetical protein